MNSFNQLLTAGPGRPEWALERGKRTAETRGPVSLHPTTKGFSSQYSQNPVKAWEPGHPFPSDPGGPPLPGLIPLNRRIVLSAFVLII